MYTAKEYTSFSFRTPSSMSKMAEEDTDDVHEDVINLVSTRYQLAVYNEIIDSCNLEKFPKICVLR